MNARDLRESAVMIGTIGIVLLAIPFMIALAFVYRFAAFAVVGVGLAGIAIAMISSPTIRDRFHSIVEPETTYKGVRLASEVSLGPGHVWTRLERDGAFLGMDDLAGTALGPIERVELPATGQRVHHGEPLFAVARSCRRIQTRSPIDGTVVATNDRLLTDPQRVNRDPYGLGWVVRIRPSDDRQQRRLLRGRDAKYWFRNEVDRLVALIDRSPLGTPSLPDGGVITSDLDRLIDERSWQRIRAEIFEQTPRVWKEEQL